jgi:hypothetical protein
LVNIISSKEKSRRTSSNTREGFYYSTKSKSNEVEAVIPESQMYSQLLSMERKLDTILSRRKMDVKEALRVSPNKVNKYLELS